jgi:hypothetical protein
MMPEFHDSTWQKCSGVTGQKFPENLHRLSDLSQRPFRFVPKAMHFFRRGDAFFPETPFRFIPKAMQIFRKFLSADVGAFLHHGIMES